MKQIFDVNLIWTWKTSELKYVEVANRTNSADHFQVQPFEKTISETVSARNILSSHCPSEHKYQPQKFTNEERESTSCLKSSSSAQARQKLKSADRCQILSK